MRNLLVFIIFVLILLTDNPVGNNIRGGLNAFWQGVQEGWEKGTAPNPKDGRPDTMEKNINKGRESF